MRGIKFTLRIAASLIVAILLFSCAQDGRDGFDGRDGSDGFDGRDGVANIQTSTYFVGITDWNITSFGAEVNVTNADITANVVSTGLVQAYFSLDSNPAARRWIALPYFDFGYSYYEGFTTFESYDNSGSPDDLWYKVVVIPQSAKIEGLNLNDYEAVQAVYGIDDQRR
jgi:hypothetical protein